MAAEISENLLIRNVEEGGDKKSSLSDRIWIESKKIWIVAAPAMFCRFTTFGAGVISQAFIGHVGSKELAAFALVFTVFVRFAQGILVRSCLSLQYYPNLVTINRYCSYNILANFFNDKKIKLKFMKIYLT